MPAAHFLEEGFVNILCQMQIFAIVTNAQGMKSWFLKLYVDFQSLKRWDKGKTTFDPQMQVWNI